MLTTEEIPAYRCLTVSIGETTIYFRHYADYSLRTHRATDGGWAETPVAPDVVKVVCGYYPSQIGPLSDYPL
jgi:hypothetical protein